MQSAKWVLAGVLALFASTAFGQGYIRLDNTSTTLIYTNDCNGNIGLLRGTSRWRLYLGTSAGNLQIVALMTNNSLTPAGRIGTSTPFAIPAGFGSPVWVQIAGETGTFPLSGSSDIGIVTPASIPLAAPSIFGTNPGQIGGFELKGLCPAYATRRLAPDGPLVINRHVVGAELGWTYTWFPVPTAYRINAAEFITGPWVPLADVPHTNLQMFFALPPATSTTRFYTIEWTNAPPAQPKDPFFGRWHYQALDKSGAVLAAGILSFTSNVPLLGEYNFTRMQNFFLHPQGTNSFNSATLLGSNLLEVIFNNEFRIRGQMIGDFYGGDWFATEPLIGGGVRRHGGRFMAVRRN